MTKQKNEIVVSNVMLYSNVMACKPEEEQEYIRKKLWINGVPGDLLVEVFPEYNNPIFNDRMTPKQLQEKRTYLTCLKCGKHCAGTCE